MTLDIRSFTIGVAGVLGLLLVGFGGGVMMGGVISGDPKTPSKVERQAAKDLAKEAKPASVAAIPTVPTVVAAPPVPAQAEAAPVPSLSPAVPPPAGTQAVPQPDSQPAAQAQPAPPQPAVQPEPRQQAQTVPQPRSLGPQRPVALMQPQFDPTQLSRREQARLRAQQRREERAQRREEWRQQMAERRVQQMRRQGGRPGREEVDDDEIDERPVARQEGPLVRQEGPFGLFRLFEGGR
jgi:outer membrane biosynthesis protein TonB